jgi:DNA-binding NarL/FixJ family response regulator
MGMTKEYNGILIVDDDPLMLFGLSKALKQKNFEVATAATGRQALFGLNLCNYDLCLINFHLPDLNGLELMAAIKIRCPKTKIILMAASFISDLPARDSIKESIDNGNCLFIAKPFNIAEATDLVIKALAGDLEFKECVRLTDEGYLDRKRKFQRKPYVKVMDIFASYIGEGEVKRGSWRAVSTDICDGGVGLLTQVPLNVEQVISFDDELSGRTGVVAWSTMLDNQFCRAGVRFI